MKLYFFGGAQQVTGSNYLLTTSEAKILIDCGLIQGKKEEQNYQKFPYQPKEIDLVLITHSHLDHIGRIPKLIKEGFQGKIISTPPTKDLAFFILEDAKKLELEKQINPSERIFADDLIKKTLDQWQVINYHQSFSYKDLEITFFDAGHILGSSFIKIKTPEKSIVFSGDLGNPPVPLLSPTENLPPTDYLVLESTYGGSLHHNRAKRKEILEDIIEEVIKEKRTLLIPAFALERTQEIIAEIEDLVENKKIPSIKVYLDSPLAAQITKIYKKYLGTNYLKPNDRGFLEFESLVIIEEEEQSKNLIFQPDPKIIIAGAGMSQGGRIVFHEEKFLPKENSAILFVGFQVEGSLGRKILEGEKEVIINGKKIPIKAKVYSLLSYSAHPDQSQLLNWIKPQTEKIKKIFLVQGELDALLAFKYKIINDLAIEVEIPTQNQIFSL